MGKYNIEYFKKYKIDSVEISICEIGNENCKAVDSPSTVRKYSLYDENNNVQKISICKNCSIVLLQLENLDKKSDFTN